MGNTTIAVLEEVTQVVEIVLPGPQGPVGDIHPSMPGLVQQATDAATSATASALSADTSEANASASAAAALASKNAAAVSEGNALASANAASGSATVASTKADEASASATAAATSATDAAASATAAATSATNTANALVGERSAVATLTNKTITSPVIDSGAANGVPYLNGSKVLTSGSALTFDGTNLGVTTGLNVGSGTSQTYIAGKALQFYNTGAGDGLIKAADDASSLVAIGVNKTEVKFYSSGSEQMRLTSTGLGIGTSSPSVKLDVNGNAQLRANGYLLFLNSDNTNSYYIQNNGATGSANPVLDFIQGGIGTRMRIDASGNLGIGTSSPSSKLDVNGVINSNDSLAVTKAGSDSVGSGPYIYLRDAASPSSAWVTQLGASGAYDFWNYTAGLGWVRKATLDSSGNLGLGVTTSAGYGLLQVGKSPASIPTTDSNVPAGQSYGHFASSPSSSDWLMLRGPYSAGLNSTHTAGIFLQDQFQDNGAYGGRYIQASGLALAFGRFNNGIIGSSNGTLVEHGRFDSGGNLGVGTSSPDSRLHIVGAGSGSNYASLRVGYNGTTTNYYDAGVHNFRGAGGIDSTVKMTLDASGRLSIGTAGAVQDVGLNVFAPTAVFGNGGGGTGPRAGFISSASSVSLILDQSVTASGDGLAAGVDYLVITRDTSGNAHIGNSSTTGLLTLGAGAGGAAVMTVRPSGVVSMTGAFSSMRTIKCVTSYENVNVATYGHKIKTSIPKGDDGFYTISLRGYDYRAQIPIDLSLSFYNYGIGGLIQYSATSKSAWTPTITLGYEYDKVVIHFGLQMSDGYYVHFDVDAVTYASPIDRFVGWTCVDEAFTGTGGVVVAYRNRAGTMIVDTQLLVGGTASSAKVGVLSGNQPAFRGDTSTSNESLILTGNNSNFQVVHDLSNAVTLYNSGGGIRNKFHGGNGNWIVHDASVGLDRMTLDASGNLGIGTSSPTPYGPSALGNGLHVAATQPVLRLNGTGTTTGIYDIYVPANTDALVFFDAKAGTNRLTLDASGNLGLGVTPSAWSGFKVFQANYGGFASFLSGGNIQTGVFSNVYFDGSSYKYISTNVATYYNQNNGVHQWINAASGTAGSPISSTQAMTLDASGNLLVGTTSSVNQTGGISRFVAYSTGGAADSGIQVLGFGDGFGYGIQSRLVAGSVANAGWHMRLYESGGTAAGGIYSTGTTTSFNTGSDYRLKNITGPVTNSGAYIDSLNPVEGTWKADGSTFVGLIAHEVQEVSRTQVATGVKDGEQMQAMDYSASELIANMIAELKSLRARVAALESR